MHVELRKPTGDHNVTVHFRKTRNILQNCGGLQRNLSGTNVCGEL